MARNFYFRYSFFFFRTPLSCQYLATRETELRLGDLRFHERASLRSKDEKRNYTDCVRKTQKSLQ